jgi:hypothetical protein
MAHATVVQPVHVLWFACHEQMCANNCIPFDSGVYEFVGFVDMP